MAQKLQLKPVFVKTKNVRNFEVMMDGLALSTGEGCLGMGFGRAGRGKSRTAQWYAAKHGCVYLRVEVVWRTSEKEFLRALCRELGILNPPRNKVPAYDAAKAKLIEEPRRAVFIDEFERLPRNFLGIVRDLSDITMVPFVLLGEEELVSYMDKDRCVWSRTFRNMEFKGIEVADIIMFASESAGLKLTIPIANILHKESGGDFRLVKRYLLALYHTVQANSSNDVSEDMVKIIIKSALRGR